MRTLWVLTAGLVALAATQGCKRKEPEPIPGPKAVPAVVGHARAAGIAWFQGSLDEAFARPDVHTTCATERRATTPVVPDLSRMRNRLNSPAPAACRTEPCPAAVPYPRPLV
jgi:hypothetical protein